MITPDNLYQALVAYNGDPILVETDEAMNELADFINNSIDKVFTPNDEGFEVLCSRLDLDNTNDVDEIHVYIQPNRYSATVCLPLDWR